MYHPAYTVKCCAPGSRVGGVVSVVDPTGGMGEDIVLNLRFMVRIHERIG